ncbi:P63C domain-containing protein, partial [Thermodesulfobacteriota bacterium]
MSKKILKSTHDGKLTIDNVEMPCFVLEDGTRVISGRGLATSIGMKGIGQGAQRIATQKTLKPYIDNKLAMAIKKPIEFKGIAKRKTMGYEATTLQELCEAIVNARDAGALKTPQELQYAAQADILIRSSANIDIISLIDEVTGYQEVRDRIALREFLDKYVTGEWAQWTQTFPDEFYKELFRLKGVPFPPVSMKRPSCVGRWVNDVVYSRLAPGVLRELKKKTPRQPKGQRARKQHQYVMSELGHPALREHLSNVIFLMKASSNWQRFYRSLQRAAPKYGASLLHSTKMPDEK